MIAQTERERERERERETERQRQRQRDRQTDRQTDRQRDRQTERQTDREHTHIMIPYMDSTSMYLLCDMNSTAIHPFNGEERNTNMCYIS